MNEKNQTNTTVNDIPKAKGKKAKKIIIAIIAIIIIATIAIGVLLATGVLDFNMSKKSKMVAGVEKLGESFTEPLENIYNSSDETTKISKNIDEKSSIEISEEISANIENLEINSLSSSEKQDLKSIIELVNNAKIGINAKYDGNEKAYINLDAKVEDINLSGEALYDGEQAGIRSEEINPKWLTISKKDLEEMLKEEGIDIEEIKEKLPTIIEQLKQIAKETEIDEKTQKEIKERYGKVLKDYINEKSKNIQSEKSKIEVDGKDKNCQKLSLELDSKDIKDLLIKYIDTFKDDKQIQDILKNTLTSYNEIAKLSGESLEADEIDEAFNEMITNIDDIKDEINEMEFDGKIKLTVYASNTEVYRTDITIDIEETEIKLETTFNKDETTIEISAEASGISLEIATITIKADENNYNLKIETSKGIEEYLGEKMFIELNYKHEKTKNEMVIKADVGTYGEGNVNIITEINKNEEKELEALTTINVDVNVPRTITAKGEIKLNTGIKVGDITIPTITEQEAVDMNDETQMEEYQAEAQEKINELVKKISENDILKSITESLINEIGDTSGFSKETPEETPIEEDMLINLQ